MTDAERIKQITDIVNDLSLDEMTEDNLFVEMRSMSFDEIFENVWEMYSVIGKIVDVLNE